MLTVHFILVEPAVPDNVGAAARAIKTMGFRSLRLVNPCDHLGERARRLAHRSLDILKNARVFGTLQDALHGVDYSVATTAKHRTVRHDYHPPEQVRRLVEAKGDALESVAVVFGREESGLLSDEVRLCDVVSSVLMKRRQPSLNLAQAVMVYAYALSPLALEPATQPSSDTALGYAALKKRLRPLLELAALPPDSNVHRRLLERLGTLALDDIHLLHALAKAVEKSRDRGQCDSSAKRMKPAPR
jgi:tRNA/rRNA methyltransferase